MSHSVGNQFPFGEIEAISEVGLVQKIDKNFVKDSVDRLIGYIPTGESTPKILLCEMKGRVVSTKAQQERERVLQFHNGETYVSTCSNAPDSWKYISKASERLQVLHHCYTYEETTILHLVGDTQQVLSGILMQVDPDLLESYGKLLTRLYNLSLEPFYLYSSLSRVPQVIRNRINEGIQVHKEKLVDFNTVKQRHMLWHKLTSASFIPIFPCKHILPILCTYWNSIKYVGDQITQILWLRKLHMKERNS